MDTSDLLDAKQLYTDMGNNVAEVARILRCDKCKTTRDCTAEEITQYLQHGWPRCCGQIMLLISPALTEVRA